jgi:hypothetical protein
VLSFLEPEFNDKNNLYFFSSLKRKTFQESRDEVVRYVTEESTGQEAE